MYDPTTEETNQTNQTNQEKEQFQENGAVEESGVVNKAEEQPAPQETAATAQTYSYTPQGGYYAYPGAGQTATSQQAASTQAGASQAGSSQAGTQQPQWGAYTWNAQGGALLQPLPAAPPAPQAQEEAGRQVRAEAAGGGAGLLRGVPGIGRGVRRPDPNGDCGRGKPGRSQHHTAAFTIYKQAENSEDTTPTVTQEGLTAQEIAQKLIPSVVCVQNYQVTQQMPWNLGTAYGEEDGGSDVSPAGEGSGVIFSEDGYIVTNQHVVDGATSLSVVTSDGTSYEATLVGEDTQTDLAVLKIDAEGLTPAEFGSSKDLQVADEVMAIGNPGGLQLSSSVTMGYVSALNRAVTNSETGYTLNCIQTDAAINPGNSGGRPGGHERPRGGHQLL